MRVIQIHNKYKIHGGEDELQINEKKLLIDNNNEVLTLLKNNNNINSALDYIRVVNNLNFNIKNYNTVTDSINSFKPDILHIYNFFPLWTTSIFKAGFDKNIPVVLSLGNYRLFCAKGTMFRNNVICNKCLVGSKFNSVKYRCYRNSYFQSFFVSRMIYKSLKEEIFNKYVSAIIVNHSHIKDQIIQAGISSEKVHIKPNVVHVNNKNKIKKDDNYALCVGRISPEKGILDLLKKWKSVNFKLKVVGQYDENFISKNKIINNNVELVGFKNREEMDSYYNNASFLVFPSLCHEGGVPLVLLEALSFNLPILASNRYPQIDFITNDYNGYIYQSDSDKDFTNKLDKLINNLQNRKKLGENSKKVFENKFSLNLSYKNLMNIYNKVKF